jgi:L-malate glycosyltransferase
VTSPQPIRVLNVVPTLLCGGTENQVMTLGRRLAANRYGLEFACLRRIGPFVSELEGLGIPLREYPISSFRSVGAVAQQARFGVHLARHRVQIVHAYNFYGNVFAVAPARMSGVPVVLASIRDSGLYLTAMQKRVQRETCRMADRVLVNAAALRTMLIDEGYDGRKIVVIPNGVELNRFEAPVNPAAFRAEIGVAPEAPLIGVVSRLHRLKGLEEFLLAAEMLAARFPAARFVIVGEPSIYEPEYLDSLRRLARDLGIGDRVVFAGRRPDVPAILASLTVSAMPSLNEALSNVLLESMAAGAPTVATRVGGTPDAMTDRVTGLLVPPGDAPALAGAIGELLTNRDLAQALGSAARRRIEQTFSVERMAEATERLYLDLLADKCGARVQPTWSHQKQSPSVR